MSFAIGDNVEWSHIPRGGWGIPYPVCVRVEAIKGERAKVAAPLKNGGEKMVWVKLVSLRSLTSDELAAQKKELGRDLARFARTIPEP